MFHNNSNIRKSILLYSAQIFSIAVGLGISVFNTHFLSSKDYGNFKYLVNNFQFIAGFFSFGLFWTFARLTAINSPYQNRLIIGTAIILTSFLGAIFIITTNIVATFQITVMSNNLLFYIQLLSPLLIVYLFQGLFEQILMGANKIKLLSFQRLLPKVLYLVVSYVVMYFYRFNLLFALMINLSSYFIVLAIIAIMLKPVISIKTDILKRIIKENKKVGFPLYLSFLSDTGSSKIVGYSISYYINTTSFGFYSLATTITQPLVLIPTIIATSFFKEFANKDFIEKKLIYFTIFISISAFAVFLVLIGPFFHLLYSDSYVSALQFSYFLAVKAIIYGIADFFNKFLIAKGEGMKLMYAGFIVGFVNVIGYVFLVKYFSVYGAITTSILSSIIYLLVILFYYRRVLKSK